MDALQPPSPLLECAALFPPLHERLMEVLDGLEPGAWEAPTIAGDWRVRDVAAHLLDGDLRKLSFHRDGLAPPRPEGDLAGFPELVAYLDQLNRDWVAVARRFSPAVLRELLRWSGAQVAAFVATLDPMAEALFPVAWAGEERSPVWMDTAREYTERWHHQQQIRLAAGAPLLEQPEYLRPLLQVSVRALPRAYAAVEAPEGTAVGIEIAGPAGGAWTLRRQQAAWALYEGGVPDAAASVTMDQRFAWRLFFKALPPGERWGGLRFTGEERLAQPVAGA
ncbi:MAG TPA: maleylpyruvate isomerase N-terminal domain-containing protein, partial [Vicinamibacteria bacterium]|nr:maleylpyruvate isomerase N-terminal domain-containing protein [Vicinamibacteria bacterium]